MTLLDGKYEHFTRFIYDAVTSVWKLLFEELFFFWYILSKASYSTFRLYIFYQYVCSLGIEPTTFCAANAMLYH